MAIAPLSIQQIVATIRQEMVARVGAPVSAATPRLQRSKNPRATQDKAVGVSRLIGHRIRALQPDDPNRGRKAFRIFLESILLNELGENLVNDPSFYDMVDTIHSQMESNPQIADAMRDAVDQLLSASQAASRAQR
jgi:hypothetical protein